MTKHNIALDYLRAFVIVLVLAYHSVIAYSVFARFDPNHYLWGAPIVDSQRWLGFDLFVLFDDIFFMPLMFFLSGLFVWPSLARKGSRTFLRDRNLRLGLPFALVVIFLMPLAYYPSFRMTGADLDFFAFWRRCFSFDSWPGGPAWFVWVLLVFDYIAARLHAVASRLDYAHRWMASGVFSRSTVFFGILLTLSAVAYLSMLLAFGPTQWFTLGPFAVWASRLLLYAVYFFAGVGVGAYGIQRGLLAPDGSLVQHWVRWLIAALAAYALVVVLEIIRQRMGSGISSLTMQTIRGVAFVSACGAIGFSMLAIFLRFANERVRVFDSLRDNAYGMYLIHYAFVIWLQYALQDAPLSAVEKAGIVFVGTLAMSWGVTAAIRCIPAVDRIIWGNR